MKESTVRKFKKAWMEKNGVDVIDTTQQNNEQVLDLGATGEQSIPYDTINMADKIMEESQSVPLPLTVSREASIEGVNLSPVKLKRRKTGTKATRDKKQLERRSKRGQYANYSPDLRAEIAKYATNHGNQQTIAYFREHFNLEVPESTVRGLRDRLLYKTNSDVAVLDDNSSGSGELVEGKRGRPMRLGKYDSVVQKCIRELVGSGEKPTSFLVVATAKQVLTEHEPQLLNTNGSLLTISWAKSFLRRMNLGK